MSKDQKKICYICYRRFPDTNFENYSKFVADSGYDVTILSFLDKGQKVFEVRDGRKIHRFPLPGPHTWRKSSLSFVLKIVGFLKKHDFSIVHMHHTFEYFSLIRILGSTDAKFIMHTTSHPITNLHSQSIRRMIIFFIQCLIMDRIIVQSEELKEKLIGIRRLRKAEIVPIGVNRKLFYPIDKNEKRRLRRSLNIHKNHSVLIYCGTIHKFRHLHRLIKAVKNVHHVFKDIKLLMIGDGNALQDIKSLAHSLNIEGSIIFTGRVPHDKVVNYIGIADLGISYIPINENFNYNPPLKTFEYLACGLPLIASRTVSNCRIIKNGFNGILVNDTPDDISNSIINLLQDKKIQAVLKKNARKSIMDFDFEHITKSILIPLYESLLGLN